MNFMELLECFVCVDWFACNLLVNRLNKFISLATIAMHAVDF